MKIVKIRATEQAKKYIWGGSFALPKAIATEYTIELQDITINGAPCKIGYDASLDVLVIGEVERAEQRNTCKGCLHHDSNGGIGGFCKKDSLIHWHACEGWTTEGSEPISSKPSFKMSESDVTGVEQ